MDIAEIRAEARRALHAEAAVESLCYAEGPQGETSTVHLRILNRIFPVGSLTGSGYTYAEQFEDNPRLIFLIEAHEPVAGNTYAVTPGEAYRVNALEPRDGVTRTTVASRLSERDAGQYGAPTAA